jgi:hypothetical protein
LVTHEKSNDFLGLKLGQSHFFELHDCKKNAKRKVIAKNFILFIDICFSKPKFKHSNAKSLSKSILYAVLNWGLGHATRSIPVIKALLAQNHKVIIASDGDALTLLKKEFEGEVFEVLPAYNAKYTKNKLFFNLKIVQQIPHILTTIANENITTQSICKKYNIDTIISDNRYGVYNKNIHSIFLSHQLHLYFPHNKLVEKTANYLHLKKIENYRYQINKIYGSPIETLTAAQIQAFIFRSFSAKKTDVCI